MADTYAVGWPAEPTDPASSPGRLITSPRPRTAASSAAAFGFGWQGDGGCSARAASTPITVGTVTAKTEQNRATLAYFILYRCMTCAPFSLSTTVVDTTASAVRNRPGCESNGNCFDSLRAAAIVSRPAGPCHWAF